MNKQRVNDWIAPAAEALEVAGIAKNGEINSKFRGQIAAFGAAITMGSLKSAAAFFAKQGGAAVSRERLLTALYYVINGEEKKPNEVFRYICEHDNYYVREQFVDAAIALKLAMNLYEFVEEGKNNEKSEPAVQ